MDLSSGQTWEQWLSVTQLNERIRDALESGFPFVRVRGEVSDLRSPASGHLYFSLIDGESRIRAVIWRGNKHRLRLTPRSGQAVLATGRVAVYPPRGEYQVIVEGLRADGAGGERERFLRLFRKLESEGLFREENKKKPPFLPGVIGVVTSASGAAIHDITRVLDSRFPNYRLLLAPARVQGVGAPEEIAAALERLVDDGRARVIICGRGGGSADDLAAFNSEIVCRAIAACPIPVVSAVGHEVDLTLADLAADLRAPTPSAAAERVMPEKKTLTAAVDSLGDRLLQAFRGQIRQRRQRLQSLASRLRHPRRTIDTARFRCEELTQRLITVTGQLPERGRNRLDVLQRRLAVLATGRYWLLQRSRIDRSRVSVEREIRHRLGQRRQRLEALVARLHGVSPLAVLERGYALARDEQGRILRETKGLRPGQNIEVTLARGGLEAEIIRLKERS